MPKRTRSPILTDVSDRPSKQTTGAVGTAPGRSSSQEPTPKRAELSSSKSRLQRRMEELYDDELNNDLLESLRKYEEQDAAETAAWDALSAEEKRRKFIDGQRSDLVEHSKPQIETFQAGWFQPVEKRFLNKQHSVRYLFQLAPASSRGAKCRFHGCTKNIWSGEFRVAVEPGNSGHWARSPDYYHLACFEEFIDFDSLYFLTRFCPDGKYQANAGAIALFNMWKKELITKIPNASREEFLKSATADALVSKVNASTPEASAPDPTTTKPPTVGGNLKIDELYTKLVENQDLGESVTEADVECALAEKDRDAFLKGAAAVDLTVKPTFAFDGFGPQGETLTKPLDADSTWQILDYLKDDSDDEEDDPDDEEDDPDDEEDDPSNEVNDPGNEVNGATFCGEIEVSKDEQATNPVEKHDPKHRLSRVLQSWKVDRMLALTDEDELSEAGKEARRQFSDGDLYRIEKFGSIYVSSPYGLPMVFLT